MYDVSHNLLPLRDLLQHGFFFDYSVPHAFRWGLLPAILTSAGFVVGLWKLKSQRRLILFFALVVAVALLLQSPTAATILDAAAAGELHPVPVAPPDFRGAGRRHPDRRAACAFCATIANRR